MDPDSFEPREHVFSEAEEEFTLDGADYLVIATVVETREPATDGESGKLKTVYSYGFSDPPQVFVAVGGDYMTDSLEGEALTGWLASYGDRVAREISERLVDRALTAYENRER
jgi:hypothetical protein